MIKLLYRCTTWFLALVVTLLLLAVVFWGLPSLVISLSNIVGVEQAKVEIIEALMSHIPSIAPILFLCILFLLIGFCIYKENKIIYYLSKTLYYWIQAFKNLFRSLSTLEVLFVLFVPTLASIYFAATIPVSYDEAITYNYFTSKPFFYCMIFYPYPNNHVLHSLLTNITDYTPFVKTLFAMRIPAILSSLFTWLVGYSFLKKYYSSRVASVVVGLASAMFLSVYYSFMSRGYAFSVLAFVVCMYAAFNIIQKGSKNKDWMFFAISGILGAYTIPSFLYPFVTLNFIILIYNCKHIKQQFVWNCVVGISVLLLYAPIMIVDGISSLTSNQFVQYVDRMDIVHGVSLFYRGMFAEIAGVPYWLLFVIPIPFIFTIVQKDKWHLSLWVIFMLAPFILLLLHGVGPFYRTFLYYNFTILFLMVVPFKTYLERISKWILIVPIVFVQIYSVYLFSAKITEYEGFNSDVAYVCDTFFERGKTYCFPVDASANYEFEADVRNIDVTFIKNNRASADTLQNYDFVIIHKEHDNTLVRIPKYFSARQNIYIKGE